MLTCSTGRSLVLLPWTPCIMPLGLVLFEVFFYTCLNVKQPKIQKLEMLGCWPFQYMYGIDLPNVLVVVRFNKWTIVFIVSAQRNFKKFLACNMLCVASMTIMFMFDETILFMGIGNNIFMFDACSCKYKLKSLSTYFFPLFEWNLVTLDFLSF